MTNNQILLVDSHLHDYTGALVAHCERGNLLELLNSFGSKNIMLFSIHLALLQKSHF